MKESFATQALRQKPDVTTKRTPRRTRNGHAMFEAASGGSSTSLMSALRRERAVSGRGAGRHLANDRDRRIVKRAKSKHPSSSDSPSTTAFIKVRARVPDEVPRDVVNVAATVAKSSLMGLDASGDGENQLAANSSFSTVAMSLSVSIYGHLLCFCFQWHFGRFWRFVAGCF